MKAPSIQFVLAVSLMTASIGYAGDIDSVCSPWFVSTVEFDRDTIPKGITITPAEKTGSAYALIVEGLPVAIGNSGTVPFYILHPLHRAFAIKLVNNKSYYTSYSVTSESVGSKKIGWHEFERPDYSIPPWLLIDLTGIVFKGSCGDNRPADTKAPEAQPFSLQTVVGDRSAPVTGRILYRLNESYDPYAQANSPLYQHFLRKEQNLVLEGVPVIGRYLAIANDHRALFVLALSVIVVFLCGYWIGAKRTKLRMRL